MNKTFCQSCGMPMEANFELYGKNADESLNRDYCSYCYDRGRFTADCTMEEMIQFCIPFTISANPGLSREDAEKMMSQFFPTLKRWNAV